MTVFNVAELEATMPDPEAVRTAATALLTGATAVDSVAEAAAQAWGKLQGQGVYVIDGAEVVFSAHRPITTASGDLAADFGTLDKAANVYADEAEALKTRLADAKARAASVERQIADDEDWRKDEDLVNEQNNVMSELNSIAADLSNAERVFANALNAVHGGPEYVEASEEGPGEGQIEYGYSRDSLNAAAMEGNVPWGHPQEYDKPWYQDVGDAISSFGKGVWSGVTGTITGLGNMVGLGGSEAFAQTWKGLGAIATDLAVIAVPGVSAVLVATGNGQRVRDAGTNLLAVGKAAIHWDEWKTDPAYAAGAASFDLASILLTAGAGATAKVGSVASKVSDVAAAGGRAGRAVEVGGLGKAANVTVKITEIAEKLKIDTARLATNVGSNILGGGKVDLGRVGQIAPEPPSVRSGIPAAAAVPEPPINRAGGGSIRTAPIVSDSSGKSLGSTSPAGEGSDGVGTRAPAVTPVPDRDALSRSESSESAAGNAGSGGASAEPPAGRTSAAPAADQDGVKPGRTTPTEAAPPEKPDAAVDPIRHEAVEVGAGNRVPDDGMRARGQETTGQTDLETPGRPPVPDDNSHAGVTDPDGPNVDSADVPASGHDNGSGGAGDGTRNGDSPSSSADGTGARHSDGGAPHGPDPTSVQQRVADATPEVKQHVQVAVTDTPGSRTPWVKADAGPLDPNTRYDVPGRGSFFTDESGRVAVVRADSLAKGLHPDLHHPLPDVVYQVDDFVMYRTDSNANTVFTYVDDYRLREGTRSEGFQSSVGRAGFEEMYPDMRTEEVPYRYRYDGGHLVGTQSGGIPERINLQAMLREINQSLGGEDSFYHLECRLIELAKRTPPVRVTVEIESVFANGGKTPSSFIVEHTEDGVIMRKQEFDNVIDEDWE